MFQFKVIVAQVIFIMAQFVDQCFLYQASTLAIWLHTAKHPNQPMAYRNQSLSVNRAMHLVLDASGPLRCWRVGCEPRSSWTTRCQTPGSVHCIMASRASPYLWRHTASPMITGGAA